MSARADAARDGTPKLVEVVLFRVFVRTRPVAGPCLCIDIGETFSGTVSMIDANQIEGKGCPLGRVGGRSQIWSRISD